MMWFFLFACNSQTAEKPNVTCSYDDITFDKSSISFASSHCQELILVSEVFGVGNMNIALEADEEGKYWTPIITAQGDAIFQGLSLSGTYAIQGQSPTRLWKQGYQSWWWSRVTALTEIEYDEHAMPMVGGDGDGLTDEALFFLVGKFGRKRRWR